MLCYLCPTVSVLYFNLLSSLRKSEATHCTLILLRFSNFYEFRILKPCMRRLWWSLIEPSISSPSPLREYFYVRRFMIILLLWLFSQFKLWCSIGGLFQSENYQCEGGISCWSSASTYNGNSFDYTDACCIA